jgi:hypothetical protein
MGQEILDKRICRPKNWKSSFPLWFKARRAEGMAMAKLRLVESKTLKSGTLALIYQPAHP